MAYPVAVTTRQITVGPILDGTGAPITNATATCVASRTLTWHPGQTDQATLYATPETVAVDANGMVTFTKPVTDQAGWQDGAGGTVTGWTYSVRLNPGRAEQSPPAAVFTLPTLSTPKQVNFDLTDLVSGGVVVVVDDPLRIAAEAAATRAETAANAAQSDQLTLQITGTVDITAYGQTALNNSWDLVLHTPGVAFGFAPGVAKTTATLQTNPNLVGQRLITRGCSLAPAFRGDVVFVTGKHDVQVSIRGTLQPTTGDFSEVAGIRIGGGTYNAQQASVTNCDIRNFNGNGVIWEQGAVIPFTQDYISDVSYDGFRCTANYDDNNHGLFEDTHVIRAGRYGYAVLYGGAYTDAYNGGKASSAHQFLNAKAFGCGENFHIETHSNVGTIFSELGTNPDHFTSTSRMNNIEWFGTVTAFGGVLDDAPAFSNRLTGGMNGDFRTTKALRAQAFQLDAAKVINAKTGTYTFGGQVITNGASVDRATGITGFSDHWVITLTNYTSDAGGLLITPWIDAGGQLHLTMANFSGTNPKTFGGSIAWKAERFAD